MESELVNGSLGVQSSQSESEFEDEIFINLTANKFSPLESSGVEVQEENKLNDRSSLESVELERVGASFLLQIALFEFR